MLAVGAGDSEDERVIADAAVFGAPGRHIGGGVRPADADAAFFGGQPAVGAAAHPVVVVAQCHDADAVLLGEGAGTLHCALCVQRAEAAVAVPALHTAHAGDALGAGKRVDLALFEVAHHPRKAIQTVAVHAGKAVLGENHSGVFGVRRGEAVLFQHAGELSDHFFVGDTFHKISS